MGAVPCKILGGPVKAALEKQSNLTSLGKNMQSEILDAVVVKVFADENTLTHGKSSEI